MDNPETIILRSNCFKLLAACFYEPDKKLFLEEKVTENLGELLGILEPVMAESAAQLPGTFQSSSEEQLRVDHAALFVGPFTLLAPPYGSVYLETGGRVQGKSTLGAEGCYDEAGLSLDMQEPADHIAIELEFMSYLSWQQAEAVVADRKVDSRKSLELQTRFFNQFMLWIPAFCERIEEGAMTDYYKKVAQCLAQFFHHCKKEYLVAQQS